MIGELDSINYRSLVLTTRREEPKEDFYYAPKCAYVVEKLILLNELTLIGLIWKCSLQNCKKISIRKW